MNNTPLEGTLNTKRNRVDKPPADPKRERGRPLQCLHCMRLGHCVEEGKAPLASQAALSSLVGSGEVHVLLAAGHLELDLLDVHEGA